MKKTITIISGLIFTGFLAANTYAADALTCQQFANTNWKDNVDTQFEGLSLSFANVYDNVNLYIESTFNYYNGNFTFSDYDAICTQQPDGSIKVVFGNTDSDGYVILQSVGDKMLKVLSGSYLKDNADQHTIVEGPFLKQ